MPRPKPNETLYTFINRTICNDSILDNPYFETPPDISPIELSIVVISPYIKKTNLLIKEEQCLYKNKCI